MNRPEPPIMERIRAEIEAKIKAETRLELVADIRKMLLPDTGHQGSAWATQDPETAAALTEIERERRVAFEQANAAVERVLAHIEGKIKLLGNVAVIEGFEADTEI